MHHQTLQAKRRSGIGTHASRKLRTQGLLPGIIYGHGEEPVAFTVDRHDAEVELQHGHHLMNLVLDGRTDSYLIKQVQHNHLGTLVVHLDLARVNLDEMVQVKVVVVLKGTPKGLSDGGVLDLALADLTVSCRASDIPNEIRVNVTDLGVGQSVTVRDLTLPEGVTPLAEPETVVAAVRVLAEAPAVAEEAPAGESAEPEVITRAKEEPDAGSGEKK